MKKIVLILLLFLAQSIVAQEKIINYADCEVYPKLISEKNFVIEITAKVDFKRDTDIVFIITKDGKLTDLYISDKDLYERVYKNLEKLGNWFPGQYGGRYCTTKCTIKMKIRDSYEEAD